MANPKTLATIFLVDGLLWTLSTLPISFYVMRHHDLPMIGTIKSLSGPFSNSLKIDTIVLLILLFAAISAFKLLASYWLWHFRMDGAVLGLILTGLSAVFWYGFYIPIGPLLGIAELILIVLVWSSLN